MSKFLPTNLQLKYFLSTVPRIESDNIVINEAAGSATVTVRLLNEIENDFVLSYRTAEFDGGANGKKTYEFIEAFILNGKKFKYEGRGAIIMTLESLYMGCTNLPGGGARLQLGASPPLNYYTLVCV